MATITKLVVVGILGSFEVEDADSQPLYIAWNEISMNAFAYNSWILIVFLSKRRSRTVERLKTVRRNNGEEARHGIMQTDYEMQLKIAIEPWLRLVYFWVPAVETKSMFLGPA